MFMPQLIGHAIIERPLEVVVGDLTMRVLPGEYPAYRMPGYAGVYVQFSGQARTPCWAGHTTINYFVPDGEAAPEVPRISLAA